MKKSEERRESEMLPDFDDVDTFGNGEDDVDLLEGAGVSGGIHSASCQGSNSQALKKQKGMKGPIDMYFTPPPEDVVNRKSGKMKQTSINEVVKKEL